jgi:perosamine synthetase
VDRFEAAFADFCGTRFAVACCNGTAALHAALLAAGIGPDDEVIVPTLTFVASANAVSYCGARPIFVDSEPDTWNLDPNKIEELITPRTRAIMPVHLYGHPAAMEPVLALAESRGLVVIEDSAQAHGAIHQDSMTGSIGDLGTFSLYGNKVLTTGEGGVVVTNSADLAAKARLFRGQGMDIKRRYWFPVIGYNYRMTNIAAAIGLGQVELADQHLQRRSEIYNWYRERLSSYQHLRWQRSDPASKPSYWLTTLILPETGYTSRDQVMGHMLEEGIETRPVFYPMHVLPPYQGTTSRSFPVAEAIAKDGISLPTWEGLTEEDVERVCTSLLRAIQ